MNGTRPDSRTPASETRAARPARRRILALVTDAYGGSGGIAAYNRDVVRAMADDPDVAEIVVIPRKIFQTVGDIPEKVVFDRTAAGGPIAYFRSILRNGLLGGRFDLIYCAHVNLVPVAWLLAKLKRTPWVLALYGIEAWARTGRTAVDRLISKADHYLPISRLTLERFRETWPVDPRSCTIMPNAIHLDQFGLGPKEASLIRKYGLDGKKVVMTLGRLSAAEQAKGFDRMIKLLPRLRDREPLLVYLICGEGDDRPNLEALARQAGVPEQVVFAGMIDEAEKADHYRLADVYAMPSHGEGFGFVFLEALACGVPCVASAIDGGREAVLDGEIGWVVHPDRPAELEDAILAALKAPRAIPKGLERFEYAQFAHRLMGALNPVMA